MNDLSIRICITLPVHNRRELTLQCLRSIARLNTKGLEIHTIIVDDGSTDGTTEAINRDFPKVEVIAGDGNLWFTEGTNVGIRAALKHSPKYILTINDDSVFDADFLRYMVETAEIHEHSVVGSLLLLWDEPHKIFQVAPVWDTWRGGWRHWYKQTVWTVPVRPWKVDVIVGNCVLFPVKVFEECGLMDAKNYPNFGDAEFTPRLKRRGWKLLIDPRARVFCQPNNIPVSITKSTFKDKMRMLVMDKRHAHNLRRRFRSLWDTAPTRLDACLGFCAFVFRAAIKRNSEGPWGMAQPEKPLSETFKHKTV